MRSEGGQVGSNSGQGKDVVFFKAGAWDLTCIRMCVNIQCGFQTKGVGFALEPSLTNSLCLESEKLNLPAMTK